MKNKFKAPKTESSSQLIRIETGAFGTFMWNSYTAVLMNTYFVPYQYLYIYNEY